jgi:NAD(P)-dependent dehydrogenase (short-subunit alcohol dehydrogenase family)
MSAAAGRVAIVTGAASGIGRATADKLHADGYTTVGVDVTDSPGGEWELRRCDVSDHDQVRALAEDVLQRHSRIDVLANVAGVVLVKALVDTEWNEFRRLIDVNLGGTFLMCKHVIGPMRGQGGGVIVNLGSVSGHVGQVDHSLYGASKGGIIALGRALAWELAPFNIRVVTVSPGSVDTPMLRGDIELEATKTGKSFEEIKKLREGEQALGRWADPPEIAEAIAFLASDRAGFITGSDLLVDCGWVAR